MNLNEKKRNILRAALIELDRQWKKGTANAGFHADTMQLLRCPNGPWPHESEVGDLLNLIADPEREVAINFKADSDIRTHILFEISQITFAVTYVGPASELSMKVKQYASLIVESCEGVVAVKDSFDLFGLGAGALVHSNKVIEDMIVNALNSARGATSV